MLISCGGEPFEIEAAAVGIDSGPDVEQDAGIDVVDNDSDAQEKEDAVEEKQMPKHRYSNTNISVSKNTEEKKACTSEKAIERQIRISSIESLVNDYFIKKFGDSYKPQIKIEDVNSGKKIVTDAIIEKPDKKIAEIIEIKAIGLKSMDSFYFIASRFIQKLQKLGIRYPVRFVIISEFMDKDLAISVQKQIHHIGFAKALGATIPSVRASFFKLENESLEEIVFD